MQVFTVTLLLDLLPTAAPDLGNLTAWGSDVVSELTLGARRSQPFI